MPFPESVETVTLTCGPVLDADGNPRAGVKLYAIPAHHVFITETMLRPGILSAATGADGTASLEVIATDSAGLADITGATVSSFRYRIGLDDISTASSEREVYLPKAHPTVAYEDLVANTAATTPTGLASTFVPKSATGTLADEHLPLASPSGQLAWVTTGSGWPSGLPLQPRSIGVDGWVYGSYNNTQMWRSGDGLATRDLSSTTFTDKQVLWVSRVQEGYAALVIDAPSPSTGDGELWFSTDWDAGWVLRQAIGPVRILSSPRWRKGPHGTVLLVGEYANNSVAPALLKLWLSVDGGQNWRAIRDTNGTTADYSSHWHQADFDPGRQRIWAVNGDGPNSWTGYSDDYGDTWYDSPFPDGHPLHSTIEGADHNKSTMLLIMGDSVHMCPDHDDWPTGIWTMDTDLGTPSTVIRQEVPVADPPSGALQWAVGSVVAQRGKEAYVSFPPNGSSDTNAYILGTGDEGRSWHLVSTIALGAGTAQAGIVGPDLHGYLYFKGFSTTAFGDLIARAPALDWTWRNYA